MLTIDFGNYVRPPRISASSGVVLTIRLLRAAPKDATPTELSALTWLRSAAMSVQASVQDRHRSSGSTLRPLGQRFDGSWAGLHGRLVATTRLVDDPDAQRAADLLANVFPDGLRFLTAGYEAEWFHSRMLLQRFETEDLHDDIVELAGQKFMTSVEKAHHALGDGLGLDEGGEPEPNAGPGFGERVAALAEAIARYGRVLSGTVDLEDPKSRTRFMTAVAPIDAYRARNRRGTTTAEGAIEDAEIEGAEPAEDELDIDSPLPPVP